MGRLGLGLGLVLRQGLGLALGLQLRIGIGFRHNHSWSSTFTPRRNHSLCLATIPELGVLNGVAHSAVPLLLHRTTCFHC